MRFVRYQDAATSEPRYGVFDGGTVCQASGDPFKSGLEAGERLGEFDDVTILPPVQPGKIICVGLNYRAHVTENDPDRQVPDEPVLFMKPPSALIGHGATIRIARPEHRTDHEAELVLVMGTTARDVMESEAMSYVLGVTAGNDVSDRVLQKKDGQWIRAKGYDTYCPVGPWVATDLDLSDLKVESRLNGVVRQSQTTASMIWSPAQLVSYISGIMTLEPGDLVMTGTPEGVGPMQPDDTIEIEVGGVGILRNSVAAR